MKRVLRIAEVYRLLTYLGIASSSNATGFNFMKNLIDKLYTFDADVYLECNRATKTVDNDLYSLYSLLLTILEPLAMIDHLEN